MRLEARQRHCEGSFYIFGTLRTRREGCLITIKHYYVTYAYYLLVSYNLSHTVDNEGDEHAAQYQAKHNYYDDHMLRLAGRFIL